MSSFMYISIHTSLTKDQKPLIDKRVLKTQLCLILPIKNFSRKTKKKQNKWVWHF